MYTTKPIRELDLFEFRELIKNKKVEISPHALFHLSNKQRKIFKEEELIITLEKETPRKIYLQENGRYAAYYRKSEGYREVILEIKEATITIVTFIATMEIPKKRP